MLLHKRWLCSLTPAHFARPSEGAQRRAAPVPRAAGGEMWGVTMEMGSASTGTGGDLAAEM